MQILASLIRVCLINACCNSVIMTLGQALMPDATLNPSRSDTIAANYQLPIVNCRHNPAPDRIFSIVKLIADNISGRGERNVYGYL